VHATTHTSIGPARRSRYHHTDIHSDASHQVNSMHGKVHRVNLMNGDAHRVNCKVHAGVGGRKAGKAMDMLVIGVDGIQMGCEVSVGVGSWSTSVESLASALLRLWSHL
jgi:hypothetical protein